MSKKINYVFCRNCRASDSFSSFLNLEGEIFHTCAVCGSEEIIFHQELYQGTDNVDRLANTVVEAIA